MNEFSVSGEMVPSEGEVSLTDVTPPEKQPVVEVPGISYSGNLRLPSASSAIDLQFLPEKGRCSAR